MHAFIVNLTNKPGTLAQVTEAIAEKGINIEAVAGVGVGDSGSLVVVTNDEAGTRRAIADAGFSSREVELVVTSLDHVPGSFATAARKLADAGINIEAAMPTGMAGDKVTVSFATDNPAKAREILGVGERSGMAVG